MPISFPKMYAKKCSRRVKKMAIINKSVLNYYNVRSVHLFADKNKKNPEN